MIYGHGDEIYRYGDKVKINFSSNVYSQADYTELKDYLAREHHMLIRDASNFRSLTPYHFRIASQTPAENDALVEAIKQFISRNG